MSSSFSSKAHQRRAVGRFVGYAVAPAALIYVVVLLINRAAGIDPELVIRDLAQTCGKPLGVGMLSNFGYLMWMAAAAISFFAALSGVAEVRGRLRALLLSGGAFSLLLCLDDMFLLHDKYIGPTMLYILYAIFALLILFRFRDLVFRIGGVSFLVAVALLGGSIILDQLQELMPVAYYLTLQLFEEGFKFVGIASWLYFWWLAAASPRPSAFASL